MFGSGALRRAVPLLTLIAVSCSGSDDEEAATPGSTPAPRHRQNLPSGDPIRLLTIRDSSLLTTPVEAAAEVNVSNFDEVAHTVTADDGSFEVSLKGKQDGKFTAPAKAGSYTIHCRSSRR